MKKGSLQIFLLIILGLTVVFSVVTFATNQNPVERPVSYVTCKINPEDVICTTPTPAPVATPATEPSASKPAK